MTVALEENRSATSLNTDEQCGLCLHCFRNPAANIVTGESCQQCLHRRKTRADRKAVYDMFRHLKRKRIEDSRTATESRNLTRRPVQDMSKESVPAVEKLSTTHTNAPPTTSGSSGATSSTSGQTVQTPSTGSSSVTQVRKKRKEAEERQGAV
jgi:hypothetical protein